MREKVSKLGVGYALVLAFLCVMIATVVPTKTVEAQGTLPQNVWVSGIQIYANGAPAATVSGVEYDGTTGKLMMDGVVQSGSVDITVNGKAINAGLIADGDLTVVLKDSNLFSSFRVEKGVYVNGDLTIEMESPTPNCFFEPGQGTVDGLFYNIYAEGNVNIKYGVNMTMRSAFDSVVVGVHANQMYIDQGYVFISVGADGAYCTDVSNILMNGGGLVLEGSGIANKLFMNSNATIESIAQHWAIDEITPGQDLTQLDALRIYGPVGKAGDIPRVMGSSLDHSYPLWMYVQSSSEGEAVFQSSIDPNTEELKWFGDISAIGVEGANRVQMYIGDMYQGDGTDLKIMHQYTATNYQTMAEMYKELRTYVPGDNVVKEYDFGISGTRDITVNMSYDAATGWVTLDGVEGLSPFAVVVSKPVTQCTVNATAGEGGSITPAGVTTVDQGGTVTYTVAANDGYQFSKLLVDGAEVAVTDNTYTFSDIQANHTVHAEFVAVQTGPVAPATGDTTNVFPWAMALVSGLGLIAINFRRVSGK